MLNFYIIFLLEKTLIFLLFLKILAKRNFLAPLRENRGSATDWGKYGFTLTRDTANLLYHSI